MMTPEILLLDEFKFHGKIVPKNIKEIYFKNSIGQIISPGDIVLMVVLSRGIRVERLATYIGMVGHNCVTEYETQRRNYALKKNYTIKQRSVLWHNKIYKLDMNF